MRVCSAGTGGPNCTICSVGTFSAGGNSSVPTPSCQTCPVGTTTSVSGSINVASCSGEYNPGLHQHCCLAGMHTAIDALPAAYIVLRNVLLKGTGSSNILRYRRVGELECLNDQVFTHVFPERARYCSLSCCSAHLWCGHRRRQLHALQCGHLLSRRQCLYANT